MALSADPPWADKIRFFFQFERLNTNYRTEILAGITTFITIAPFLLVNANLLSNAVFIREPGDLFGQILVAIALSAALVTALLGSITNYPIALLPGTGLIALFVFSIVKTMQLPWQLALSAVFIQGLLFTGLSFSRFRHQIIQAVPASIREATVAGIGMFIAYVGLSGDPHSPTLGAGIIVADAATKTALGSLGEPATLLAIAGLLLTAGLMVRQVNGAMLWGVLATAILGWLLHIAPLPQGIFSIPEYPNQLMGAALNGFQLLTWQHLGNFVAAILILFFVSVSDTIGAFTGLAQQSGRMFSKGRLAKDSQFLQVNAVGTTVGALMGMPSFVPYLESASGIAVGGRSGFSSLLVSGLFLVFIWFTPLFAAIPMFATAAPLILVGMLMMGTVRNIDWSDWTEAIPAFLMILTMPLTFSIADGLAIGFISHALLKLFQNNLRALKRIEVGLAIASLAYFVLMTLEL